MKCEIELAWRGVGEDLTLSRTKEPDEVWTHPAEGYRSVIQMIDVLDRTYADIRAALVSMLPDGAKEQVHVVMFVTSEQARKFAGPR